MQHKVEAESSWGGRGPGCGWGRMLPESQRLRPFYPTPPASPPPILVPTLWEEGTLHPCRAPVYPFPPGSAPPCLMLIVMSSPHPSSSLSCPPHSLLRAEENGGKSEFAAGAHRLREHGWSHTPWPQTGSAAARAPDRNLGQDADTAPTAGTLQVWSTSPRSPDRTWSLTSV